MDKNTERAEKIKRYPSNIKIRGFEIVSDKNKKNKDIETKLPTKGSKNSAGYDLYSKEEIILQPGESHIFWTDIKSYMVNDEVLKIYIRSSLGIKKDLILKNQVGIIDSDYFDNLKNEGNIGVCLKNNGTKEQKIEIGDRIAQGIFSNILLADNIESEEERKGGIGSTN